jgi:hypothetical protein
LRNTVGLHIGAPVPADQVEPELLQQRVAQLLQEPVS